MILASGKWRHLISGWAVLTFGMGKITNLLTNYLLSTNFSLDFAILVYHIVYVMVCRAADNQASVISDIPILLELHNLSNSLKYFMK